LKIRKLLCSVVLALAMAVTGVGAQAIPVAAAVGDIELNIDMGPIGTQVRVTGDLPGSGGVALIRFGSRTSTTNQIQLTAAQGGNGTVNRQFNIPEGYPGGNLDIYVVRASSATTTNPSDYSQTSFTITPRITSISPDKGPAGSTITIQGDGFVYSGASYYIYFNNERITPLSGGSINSSGKFNNVRITIPDNLLRGSYEIYAVDRQNGNATTEEWILFNVESALTITPTSGASGDTLTLTGTGFAGGNTTFYFNGQLLDRSVTVPTTGASAGKFSTTIVVPATTSGEHTITAKDSSGEASAKFTINQQITVSPTTPVSVGDNITITGNGFAVNQSVVITIDGTQIAVDVTTTSSGSFTVTFPMPNAPKGARTIGVKVGTGTASTATITVREKITEFTPKSGPRGSVITIKGTGFTPGTAAITLDGVSIGNVTVENNGVLAASVTIPATAAFGERTVAVQGITQTFTVDPEISVSPDSGTMDDTITVTGNGFRPGKTVTFILDDLYSLGTSPGTVVTKEDGSFTATFKVPNLPQGEHTIKVSDGDDTGYKSGSGQFTINQKIYQMSSSDGKAGDTLSIVGTGFAPNKRITVSFGSQVVSTTPSLVTTGEFGSFSADFTIPAMPAGNITITVTDGTNSATAIYALKVTADISLTTSSTSPGWVGLEVTVEGTGFKANSPVSVTFDGGSAAATGTTNAQGGFSIMLKIPPMSSGAHKMKVGDGVTEREFTFYMEDDAPQTPALSKPLAASKPKQPVSFAWSDVSDPSGVTYEFQLSQDSTFTDLIYSEQGIAGTTLTLPADQPLPSAGGKTPYLWRVRAVDGAGNASAWSTPHTFSIGFMWPGWLIHVWYSLGILVALVFGMWFGRRMAYQSY